MSENYCRSPGCVNRVPFDRRLCESHRAPREGKVAASYEKSAYQRWYSQPGWRKMSKSVRAQNPFCEVCTAAGRVNRSTQVDHIVPHDGDPAKFWDRRNLQAICASCHSIKTRTERGGAFKGLHS